MRASLRSSFVIPGKARESGDPVGHDARLPVEKPCVQAEARIIGRVA